MGSCKRCPRNRIYGHVQCNGRRSEEGLTEPINSRTSLEYGRFVDDANKVYAKLLPACLAVCPEMDLRGNMNMCNTFREQFQPLAVREKKLHSIYRCYIIAILLRLYKQAYDPFIE